MNSAVPAPAPLDALLRERTWVVALARHLAGDTHRGDDLAQDAFVAALESPPRAGAARGWFATVLRHGVSRRARADERRARRERVGARPESVGSASEAVERAEAHERVVRALLALEEPYRSALVLRFFEDLPPREIGRRTGVGAETARSRVQRGVALLRGRLGADDDPRSRRAAWLLVTLPRPAGLAGGPLKGVLAVGTKTKLAAVVALACLAISFVAITVHETLAPDGGAATSTATDESAVARRDEERRPRGAAPADESEVAQADLPVTPRAPRPVHGVVCTRDGMPVAGARVTPINPASLIDPLPPDENLEDYLDAVRRRLRTMINFDMQEDDPSEPAGEGTVATGPDGGFAFDDVGSNETALRATAPGYTAGVLRGLPAPGRGARIELVQESAVEGIVRDDVGDPVAGRHVFVLGQRLGSAVTGSDGRYRIGGLAEGTWPVVLAEAWRRESVADAASVEVRAGVVATQDFVVLGRRMRALTGTVVRCRAPVSGAIVRIADQPCDPVTTDARGRFRIEALLEDAYLVYASVEGPDGMSAGCAEVESDSTSAPEPLVVELPDVRCAGRVIDAETGAPVAGASVVATEGSDTGRWWTRSVRGVAKTGADGRFQVTGPAEGEGMLTVEADGYAPRLLAFVAGDTQPVQVELVRGRALRVDVVRDDALEGRPVLVFASCYEEAMSLGVDGPLAKGATVTLRVGFDVGWVSVVSDDTIPVLREISAEDTEIEVRLVAAGTLRVRVLDRRGEPFTGAWVGVVRTDGGQLPGIPLNPWRASGAYATWRDGTVTRTGIPPGRYRVEASSPTGMNVTTTVDVVAGPATEVVLKLE